MDLLTPAQRGEMVSNGAALKDGLLSPEQLVPVILLRRLGLPPAAWLLAAIDPSDQDQAFGLCHVGASPPALEWVSLSTLTMSTGGGRSVVSDPFFAEAVSLDLAYYLEAAATAGQIIPWHTRSIDPEGLARHLGRMEAERPA